MTNPPLFSIIIPIQNDDATLPRCLHAITTSAFTNYETILILDAPTDNSLTIAQQFDPTHLLINHTLHGLPAARDRAAQHATGDYLFFLAPDCELHPNTLANAATFIQLNPNLTALIGNYDNEPLATNITSQFHALFQYYRHHTSNIHLITFWAECGLIRRTTFNQLGGFLPDNNHHPLAHIHLGDRLHDINQPAELAPDIQVKCLRRYTFRDWQRQDWRHRAWPWAQHLYKHGLPQFLLDNPQARDNLATHHASAILLFSFCTSILLNIIYATYLGATPPHEHNSFFTFFMISLPLFFLLNLLFANRHLYRFFFHHRHLRFALPAILLHWLYYTHSLLAYILIHAPRPTKR
ncbi:MAG TPA: glycosyltransferase family 2 protein [Anaerolineae bacterium]|nr:glycosyltransferase family 2 protein [Anaerolineae bacterium]